MAEKKYTESIVGIALGLLIILLNLCEMKILHKRKKKRLYESLLLSLSVSDLFLGVSELSISIVYISGIFDESPNYAYMTYFFFLLVSILHLLCISIDRLYAVAYPIHHKTHQRGKTTKYLIGASWDNILSPNRRLCNQLFCEQLPHSLHF